MEDWRVGILPKEKRWGTTVEARLWPLAARRSLENETGEQKDLNTVKVRRKNNTPRG